MKKKIGYSILIILTVTVLIYGNSLYNGYNMDDSLVVTNNKLIHTKNIASIFTQHSFQSDSYNFAFRPLSILSFYIENYFFGKSPLVSHLINLILYGILGIVLFFLLLKIYKDTLSSLLITLLFIAFPLHTEVVDNIKNREEICVSICGFLSLFAVLKSIERKNYYYLIPIFLLSLIGLLFKTSYFIFPPIIAIIAVLYQTNSSLIKRVKIFSLFFLVSSASIIALSSIKYLLLEKGMVNREFEFFENPLYFTSIYDRILPSIGIIGHYIILLLNPFKLSYYYGYNVVNMYNYTSLNFLMGLLFLIFIVYALFKQFKNRTLIFGLTVLIINLLLISNFIKPLAGIIAERFIFNGSLGFCIVLYYILSFISTKFKNQKLGNLTLYGLFFLIFVSFSVKTFIRNKDWKNEITLYTHDIKNVPNSVKANEMLAGVYYKKYFIDNNINTLNLSEKYYINTISIYPNHPSSLNNLGTINFIKKDYHQAINYYLLTLKFKEKPLTHYNLAESYTNINNIELAKEEYEMALLGNPNIPDLFSHYKQLIVNHNLTIASINFLEKEALTKYNDNLNIYLLLIDLNNELKNYKEMLIYLEKANQLNPSTDYVDYIKQLENYLQAKGN